MNEESSKIQSTPPSARVKILQESGTVHTPENPNNFSSVLFNKQSIFYGYSNVLALSQECSGFPNEPILWKTLRYQNDLNGWGHVHFSSLSHLLRHTAVSVVMMKS